MQDITTERLLPAESSLTNREIAVDISSLALPIILTDMSITLNIFFNAQLISSLQPEEDSSAAAAIIFSMQAVLTVAPSAFFYMIFSVIYNPVYEKKEKTIITNSLILAVLLSAPIAIFSYFIGEIFSYAGTPRQVCDIVNTYYAVFAFDFPFHLMAVALHQFAIARRVPEDREWDRQRLLYVGGAINFVSVAGLSWLLTEIYPLKFLSKLQTIALSFVFGDSVRLLYYGFNFFREGGLFEKLQEISWATHAPLFLEILIGGWKLSLQLLSELGSLSALSFLAEVLLPNKTVNLDILNAMNQWFLFLIIVPLSLAQTAQQKLGTRCYEKKYDQVQRYGNIILLISSLYHVLLLTIVLALPIGFLSLFMNPNENNNSGISGDFRAMFAIVFTGLWFTAFRNIIGMALRPLAMIKVPMMNSIMASWLVSIPSAILLAKLTDWGVAGILLGYYLGEAVGALNLLRIWCDVSWPLRVQEIHEDQDRKKEVDEVAYWHCSSVMYARLKNFCAVAPPEGYVALDQATADV